MAARETKATPRAHRREVEAVTALTTSAGAPTYHVTLRDLTFVRTAQRGLRYQAA